MKSNPLSHAFLLIVGASFALLVTPARTTPAQAQSPALSVTQAQTQLRAAVSANNEAALQQIEAAFPATTEATLARFLRGYLRLQAKDFANAASLLSDPTIATQTELGDYALYHRAQAMQENSQRAAAEQAFRQLAKTYPTSLLARTGALQAAGAAFVRSDYGMTLTDLASLAAAHDGTALKLKADALEKLGRSGEAINALRQLFFDAPQSAEAAQVPARLLALGSSPAATDAAQLRRRADKLFDTGLYVLAAQAYEQHARQFPAPSSDEVWLKAGISYYKGNSFAAATAALSHARARTPKQMAEAAFYQGLAHVATRNDAGAAAALSEVRRVAPDSPRAGELLLAIGRVYERRNQPESAAAFYEQMTRHFPAAPNADDAHFWLAWRAHTNKDFASAARLLLEHLARYGTTTDNRGKAAFWAAVDAERSGQRAQALTLYRALLKRYGAGWYGVNAERRAGMLAQAGVQPIDPAKNAVIAQAIAGLQGITQAPESLLPADRERLAKAEQLTRIALQQSAFTELEAARDHAPTSPLANLRIAQIYRARNENVAAINALKRAYPDYGQTLPEEMTREEWDIFYPLSFWPAIKEQARLRRLDPYFVAGLIRQETVFNAQARSRANALGLMQILPSTGQLVAKRYSLGGGRISSADLFNPMLNIQLGTAYLEQLVGEFGRMEYVAAAYNGGPTRVARWTREFPTIEIEEWVESIPISETRLYVQGVYRNMRQYQRLYDEQGHFKNNVPHSR